MSLLLHSWLYLPAVKTLGSEYFSIMIAIIKTTKQYGVRVLCMCTRALQTCACGNAEMKPKQGVLLR